MRERSVASSDIAHIVALIQYCTDRGGWAAKRLPLLRARMDALVRSWRLQTNWTREAGEEVVIAYEVATTPAECNGACKEFQHLTACRGARQAEPQEVAA